MYSRYPCVHYFFFFFLNRREAVFCQTSSPASTQRSRSQVRKATDLRYSRTPFAWPSVALTLPTTPKTSKITLSLPPSPCRATVATEPSLSSGPRSVSWRPSSGAWATRSTRTKKPWTRWTLTGTGHSLQYCTGQSLPTRLHKLLFSPNASISLANRKFLQRSNRMQIESNDFFDIRFDLEENVSKKTLNCDGKEMIISKEGMSNEIFHYFCHPGGRSLCNGPIYWWPIKFNDCWGGFVSNRIVFWIESKSNRKVSGTSRSKIESNRNQFDLTALVCAPLATFFPSWELQIVGLITLHDVPSTCPWLIVGCVWEKCTKRWMQFSLTT